ncbi:MAG: polyphosphate kinase 2 family protein [Bacteroidales bacterium]|nr:polyphosphate kinase 2 family protein [Bacteroidales bacterium]MBN2697727.1 polyphosphate kinase 2 family protein [Bacteroidales bacterium]
MKLSDYTTFNPDWDKEKTKDTTKNLLKKIGELQYKMYAQQKYSLLILFQGTDASGKDGLTRGLLRYCNPVGIRIESFKKPTAEEYAHDFLWRIHQHAPAKGEMQIFIRSHYEDILVPAVEKLFPEEVVEKRFRLINDFERLLEHNDTRILKFFLYVSPEEQKERLMERVEMKEKHWKHKDGDWETRKKFPEYMKVYERIFRECNDIPWHIVPADKNWQKLYYVAVEVLKTLEEMDLKWPRLESELFGK